jgi:DNA-binding transcriptional MerR regulator
LSASLKLPIAEPEAASPDADARLLRVGDLAQRTGKTVRALHLYEELGLLQPSERSKGGYRLYDAHAVVRVRWIAKLQDMAFTLPEIREILVGHAASGSASGAMQRVRDLYQLKLAETRAQIERLAGLARELEHSVAYLDGCETCEPERLIRACASCDLPHGCTAPELVAGLHSHRD